jgi:hypothetical protein
VFGFACCAESPEAKAALNAAAKISFEVIWVALLNRIATKYITVYEAPERKWRVANSGLPLA